MIGLPRQAFLALWLTGLAAGAQEPVADPDPARFDAAIEAFVAWDRKNSAPESAVLFVGSSSIRFWQTARAFPEARVINRGFGGAHISDVLHFYDRVVGPYDPAAIVFYAGDNDIGAGKSPERVLADFMTFAARARADFPRAQILFLAIKPSILRWVHWPTMVEANRIIADYVDGEPGMRFVDVASPLLGPDGEPKDVFMEDGLHLNADGYRLWEDVLEPVLDEL